MINENHNPVVIIHSQISNKDVILAFNQLEETIAFYHGDNIDIFFDRIEKFLDQGYWLAGYFFYEFGYYLEKIFKPLRKNQNSPLAWIVVSKKPKFIEKIRDKDRKKYSISDINYNLDFKNYEKGIEKIKAYLKKGLSYQVNYTFKLNFAFNGDPLALYQDLSSNQPTKYRAFINTGKDYILSFSPELFFYKLQNKILVSPMKGTMARGENNSQDQRNKKILSESKKIRAENLMIVDLLRNDLGRICQKVKVNNMFNIEKYKTLYQMTSSIQGQLKDKIRVADIFSALFPSGSVTGAPKIKTMQIIQELETQPRGIYTGAIGYIAPNRDMCFNVAIRTLHISQTKGQLGIGGGIVYDSKAKSEYQEALLKAKFFI